jgi:hypothetical protein
MSQERDARRQHIARGSSNHEAELAPGRASRSAVLDAPTRPVAGGLLQRKARDGCGVEADAAAAVSAASGSSGDPLPSELRSRFESSLGTDLSAVRIHAGRASAEAASAVGALAFAIGNDIHFGHGSLDVSSLAGQQLLAHEVAHTVQQSGGTPRRQNKLEVSSPLDPAELEADRAGEAMVRGESVEIGAALHGARGALRRQFNASLTLHAPGLSLGSPPARASTGGDWVVPGFAIDSDELPPAATTAIEQIVAALRGDGLGSAGYVTILGYADPEDARLPDGTAQVCEPDIALRRAQRMRDAVTAALGDHEVGVPIHAYAGDTLDSPCCQVTVTLTRGSVHIPPAPSLRLAAPSQIDPTHPAVDESQLAGFSLQPSGPLTTSPAPAAPLDRGHPSIDASQLALSHPVLDPALLTPDQLDPTGALTGSRAAPDGGVHRFMEWLQRSGAVAAPRAPAPPDLEQLSRAITGALGRGPIVEACVAVARALGFADVRPADLDAAIVEGAEEGFRALLLGALDALAGPHVAALPAAGHPGLPEDPDEARREARQPDMPGPDFEASVSVPVELGGGGAATRSPEEEIVNLLGEIGSAATLGDLEQIRADSVHIHDARVSRAFARRERELVMEEQRRVEEQDAPGPRC